MRLPVFLLLLFFASVTQALQLVGISHYTHLNKPFYLAALYSQKVYQEPALLLDRDEEMEMVMRVTVKRWKANTFKRMWLKDVSLNNNLQDDPTLSEALKTFSGMLEERLTTGDEIKVHYLPGTGTQVWLNEELVTTFDGKAVFNALLRTWIGDAPPNNQFKDEILGLDTDRREEYLVQFNQLTVQPGRGQLVSQWKARKEQAEAQKREQERLAQLEKEKREQEVRARQAALQAEKKRKAQQRREAERKKQLAAQKAREQQLAAQKAAREKAAKEKARASAELAQREKQREQEANKAQQTEVVSATVQPVTTPAPQPVLPEPAITETAQVSVNSSSLTDEQKAEWEDYKRRAIEEIKKEIEYPPSALRSRQGGKLEAQVTIDSKGAPVDIKLTKRTRYGILNRAIKKAVDKVGEFEDFPEWVKDDTVVLTVDVEFKPRR